MATARPSQPVLSCWYLFSQELHIKSQLQSDLVVITHATARADRVGGWGSPGLFEALQAFLHLLHRVQHIRHSLKVPWAQIVMKTTLVTDPWPPQVQINKNTSSKHKQWREVLPRWRILCSTSQHQSVRLPLKEQTQLGLSVRLTYPHTLTIT